MPAELLDDAAQGYADLHPLTITPLIITPLFGQQTQQHYQFRRRLDFPPHKIMCLVRSTILIITPLSNATCLIRPHVLYALFIVSRITIICYIIRHL